ncbi:hypothetical protein L207DRAFT_628653 [Hyaloscypha variabilis F]|uniref:Uncharacterized protein n=1 Tax=Hyaloscypha variabilis (strain UAMH 11265 / GT02V1 / F) TaxID=1149755 RepID=A0A2J6S5I4_HYAVF|nr:hypothetical protein L207DRAFT_628653 [Hyaloscypha variabilis F]
MASSKSKSNLQPQSTGRVQLQWINEGERRQDKKSHLRTLVRSNAKVFSDLRRRQQNTAATPSTTYRRPLAATRESKVSVLNSQDEDELLSASEQISESSERYLHQQREVSPQTILGAGRVDPFNSYPIEMTSHAHRLLDYCKSSNFISLFGDYIPMESTDLNVWKLVAEACDGMMPNPGMELISGRARWVPICIANQMGFKSALLSADMSIRANLGLDPRSPYSISLMADCVELLRKEIDNPKLEVTDMMLVTVVHLGRGEIRAKRELWMG